MSSLEARSDDKEHDYLFEGPSSDLFDQWLSEDPESLHSSDNSNDSNLFDDLDLGLSAQDVLFDASSPFAATTTPFQPIPSWKQSASRQDWSSPIPKTQKLAYRLKPDGAAISAGDLLALEGRIPTTPPATPNAGFGHSTAGNINPSRSSINFSHLCHRTKTAPRVDAPALTTQHPVVRSMPPEASRRIQRTKKYDDPHLPVPQRSLPWTPPPSSSFPQAAEFGDLTVPHHTLAPDSRNRIISESSNTVLPEDVLASFLLESAHQDPWSSAIDPQLFPHSPPLAVDWPVENTGAYNQSLASTSSRWPPLDTSFDSMGLGISFGDLTSSPLDDPFADPLILSSSPSYHNHSPDVSPRTSRSRFDRSTAPSPSPHDSPRDSRRRRRSKVSQRQRPASGSKTPRSASGAGALDFVNFTASDNQKILTGVAPSGSSKTKARREREASERRKKLSQAAAKAVREAGGDVEALRKEGLLV